MFIERLLIDIESYIKGRRSALHIWREYKLTPAEFEVIKEYPSLTHDTITTLMQGKRMGSHHHLARVNHSVMVRLAKRFQNQRAPTEEYLAL